MAAGLAGLLLLTGVSFVTFASQPASAYESTTATWTGASGGNTTTATQPSGLVETITTTGQTIAFTPGSNLSQYSAASSEFTPAISATSPAAYLDTHFQAGGCPVNGTCPALGTITLNFSDPVTNPVLHFAGVGGSASTTVGGNATSASALQSNFTLTGATLNGSAATATLGSVSAGATNLSVAGSTISDTSESTSPFCNTASSGSGIQTTATAGCGSVPIVGTVSSVSFAVGGTTLALLGGGNMSTGAGDAYQIAVTEDQHFSDAPASYDGTQAPAHLVGDLKLGSTVVANNTTVANSTTSPVVASGAAVNSTAAGEDAITSFPTLSTANIGSTYNLAVPISGASQTGQVCGYIDFSQAGNFTAAADKACANFTAGQTSVSLSWTIPAGMTVGTTYVRLRAAYGTTQAASPTGLAASGEVEDYELPIVAPASTCSSVWYTSRNNAGSGGTYGTVDASGFHIVGNLASSGATAAMAISTVNSNLAYVTGWNTGALYGDGNLWVLNLTTGAETKLTAATNQAFISVRFALAPDGTLWSWSGNGHLYQVTLSADGQSIVSIVDHGAITATAGNGGVQQPNSLASGDIAFDGLGNMWLLATNSNAAQPVSYLYSASASNLTATGGVSAFQVGPVLGATNGSRLVGLAFGSDGTLYASGSSNEGTAPQSNAFVINTNTGASTAFVTTVTNPQFVTDLASCALPLPNITVTKAATSIATGCPTAGSTIKYTITVANTGNLVAADTLVNDSIPANTAYVAGSTTLNGSAVADAAGGMPYASPATVSSPGALDGNVAPGASAVVTFEVTVNTPVPGGVTTIANQGVVSYIGGPNGGVLSTPFGQTVAGPTISSLCLPDLAVIKAVAPVSTTPVAEGQTLTYTLTFDNSMGTAPAVVDYTDDLSKVVDDATVTVSPALASGAGVTVGAIAAANTFPITGTLAAGATATVTYSVKVNSPDKGDHQLDNYLVPTGTTPPTSCVAANPDCTTNPVPDLVVTKSVNPASTTPVAEGQTLVYTLTFDNSLGKAPAAVDYTDDLSKVVDDATVTVSPALASGAGVTVGAIAAANTFPITGTLAAGATATVTYSVKVNSPDKGDHQLDNYLVPTGTTPPTSCVAANPDCTTNPVPDLVVTKSVNPASTTPVAEGQTLVYTLTFDNSLGKAPAAVDYTDDLSKVVDDATLIALATSPGLTVGALTPASTFSITGTVAAGATATIAYAVKVNSPDKGDHQLDNYLVPTGITPPTSCLSSNPDCTTNPVPDLVVSKSVNPASTTTVVPGQTLTYTLSFDNTAGKAPATVNRTDDLSDVLDDATVTVDPTLATGAGLTVSSISGTQFTITGSVAAGATASVTYTVKVNNPDKGNQVLNNYLVQTGTTPPSRCAATDPDCTTNPVKPPHGVLARHTTKPLASTGPDYDVVDSLGLAGVFLLIGLLLTIGARRSRRHG